MTSYQIQTKGVSNSSYTTNIPPSSKKIYGPLQTVAFPVGQKAISNTSKFEDAFLAMKASNIFSSKNEFEENLRMASLAAFTYREGCELSEVSALFQYNLFPLPTPQELKVSLPKGLKVQAYRHGNEVIIAIRGTELNKGATTLVSNLIADLGIGRHKSNEDLISSLKKVNNRVSQLYGFNIGEQSMKTAESLINSRITGDNDSTRSYQVAGRVATAWGQGALKGGGVGGLMGLAGAAGLVLAGMASGGAGLVIGGVVSLVSAAAGSTINLTVEAVKTMTIADGYPTLQAYIKAIDCYMIALKGESNRPQYIKDNDTVITVGHSLAGYLAAVIGAVHADEIYSFNGPGVILQKEVGEIMTNLGLKRKVQEVVTYHNINMEGDFIGNIGKRDGSLRHLSIPKIFKESVGDFPACGYNEPTSHHGINMIAQVLKNSSIQEIYRKPISNQHKERKLLKSVASS